MKDTKKIAMGKKSRKDGGQFELRVRKDLEDKGWTVDKWTNNVELPYLKCIPLNSLTAREHEKLRNNSQFLDFMQTIIQHDGKTICENHHYEELGKLVKAKAKWGGPGRPMMMGAGFPDFIAFRLEGIEAGETCYNIIGVECKTNGYLDKKEREKCRWMLDNHIFSKILIAEKTKVKNRVVIIYHDFEEKYGSE